ncbi:MAG: cyclodeaminase/cyclohydrolase family protein [Atribacterota bacterium]|jgi:glutamate formiminotransferase/formiminotetrahydrofolate cyclodeaminase|nr:cyclodeaminase/cyclohydrolase family protein [Atribacterota bacterium]MDD4895924.1 cyclodeaminase/cyclohydrolase family protein [Atribacterota bacterium]MDD5637529.1 cyclodeaminase/cyclohydrolase family protein [Atribacterota bacterium]
MLKDMKIKNFMDLLASRSATPGGGSVAALTGAMGAALLSMVSNLTVGKEKYQDVEEEIKELLKKSERLRATLEELMEKDIEAFNQLMAVMKLPKTNEEEKKDRNQKMQIALIEAAKVPLAVARKSKELIDMCQEMARKGNKNAISDVGVGVLLAEAAFNGAVINVKVNMNLIKDENLKKELTEEIKSLTGLIKGEKDRVLEIVLQRL